jgi:nucleoside-diphosphate-sugar epimerase
VRILIIGGTRFIGPPVVKRLHALGHTLALFHRHKPDIDLPDTIEHIYGDRRKDWVTQADTLRAFEPEIVLDMIPIVEADAQAVMSLFTGLARRVVAISSQDVYRAYGRVNGTEPGHPDPVPLTEDSPLREKLYPYRGETPRTPTDPRKLLDDYDKILVERVVMADPALPGTILRLPALYGPNDYQHRVFEFLKRMDDGRPAILMSEQTANWRWTRDYVENTAAGIVLAVTDDRATGRTYNLGTMPTLTMAEWVGYIGDAAGWSGEVVTAPDYQLPEDLRAHAGMDQDLVTDSTRIRAELGYTETISLGEGLMRTVAWERAHPPDHIDPAQFDYAAEDAILTHLNY